MRHFLSLIVSYFVFTISSNTLAQVVSDQTVNTQVNQNGNISEITGGKTRGNNLFHSFQEFSLETGKEVFFNNLDSISRIFSRVTGGKISRIDGLIRANGTADLFLINPNGIIFGNNASLDIGGSFIGSTADSIQFADGSEFKALDSEAEPLLTVSIPIGLQYGKNPGDITVRGLGNNLSIDLDTFTVNRGDRPVGLEVASNHTLSLIGGNVFLPGGNLTAIDGRIVLGSVNDKLVTLTPDDLGWNFNYEGVDNFQDINLSQAASLEVSGNGGGEVFLQGKEISLVDGSAILADTLGDDSGRVLTISATESLELIGFAPNNAFPTRLSTDVDLDGTGNGGDLLINTNYLFIAEGAQVNSGTFGAGDAGNLTVTASAIEVIGESQDGEFISGLFAQADFGETGNGGNLKIETDSLLVAEGADISTTTFGTGNAGNLAITANNIELRGFSPLFASGSGLSVTTEGTGNGGNLDLITDSLFITQGADISSTTFGGGDAGNLNIQADTIELNGGAEGVGFSGLFANVEPASSGNGGNINIQSNNLSIVDGAQISATANGVGNAGTLNIKSQEINLVGTSPSGIPSGIFANAAQSEGSGGKIAIATSNLQISGGAQIATSTLGSGDGGDLEIVADNSVVLTGTSSNGSSGLFANALLSDGSGGNLTVRTNFLSLLDGATISVGNFPSSDNSPFTPGEGAAGNLNIIASEILLNEQGSISADTFTGDRGNINLQSNLLTLRRGSQISTNAQETATGGNITIDVSDGFLVAVPQENSDITANAVFGDGGRVDIVAAEIFGIEPRESLTPFSDITASSEFGIAGNIILQTQDLNPTEDLAALPDNLNSPQLAQGCQIGTTNDSSFINIGRGGLNPQPDAPLGGDVLIGDVQLPRQWSQSNGIVEAKTWKVSDRGTIVLVADSPAPSVLSRCQLD